MSKPYSVILIPPVGDKTLLAGEPGGGRVPTLTWCYLEMTTGEDLWCVPTQGARPNEPRVDVLLLVHERKPVPSGIFRAWYMADDTGFDDLGDLLTEGEPFHGQTDVVEWASSLKRNGTLLGRVAVLNENGVEITE